MRDDVERAMQVILSQMALQAREGAGDEYLTEVWAETFAEHGPAALGEVLARWAQQDERPLVLLVDEIDSLVGDTLLSVLRQLVRKYVVECKVASRRRGLDRTVAEGVEQTAAYMDRCGAEAGHLVVFDQRENRSWEDKVFRTAGTAENGVRVAVWGM